MDLDLTTMLPLLAGVGVGVGVLLRVLLQGHRARYREEMERRAYLDEIWTEASHTAAEEIDRATEREIAEAEARADDAVAARLGDDPAGDAAELVRRGRS